MLRRFSVFPASTWLVAVLIQSTPELEVKHGNLQQLKLVLSWASQSIVIQLGSARTMKMSTLIGLVSAVLMKPDVFLFDQIVLFPGGAMKYLAMTLGV
jgi:hypothetical protein